MIASYGKETLHEGKWGVLSEMMMGMAVLLFRSHLCLCHGLERASGRAWS